tara:strand:+ start:76 stop:441 length:366 start_codon:yes stop_codon:yes gene_type:complete
LGNPVTAAWTSLRPLLAGKNLVFTPVWVGDDSVLEEYDRVLASVRVQDSDGNFGDKVFTIAFHAPKGSITASGKKRVSYPIGDTCWIKSVSKKAHLEVVFGETDPAEGVNYSVTTVEPLPF